MDQGGEADGVALVLEAGKLAREKAISDPVRQMPYQPFGDLRLTFPGHENVTDYRRELDLDSALASVTYKVGDVQFVRSAFASHPDRVIVLQIMAMKPGQISFTLKMDSPHTNSQTRVVDGRDVIVVGDEVYEHILFDGRRHESLARYPELSDRSVVISSFGKTYHATGWKVGYCAAPQALSAEIQRVHQFVTFAVNGAIQHAYAEIVTRDSMIGVGLVRLPAVATQG